jgi:hypothetical protein
MSKLPLFGASVAGLALTSLASAQTFSTIATETFDYPNGSSIDGQIGDFGWFQQWFAGGAGSIEVPGLDATGGMANTTGNNAGAFRQPKTGPWVPTVAPGFNFGGTGFSIWVSFTAQRPPSSNSAYGGLSLHTSFVGEKLFLGSPFQSNEWGLAIPGCCSFQIAGSDVTQVTRYVARIDYQAGDERCRVWLNPAVAHPTTTPDLDVIVADHTWNEIRLQSGEGGANGWLWDDIVIECADCLPDDIITDTATLNVAAGGVQNMQLFGGLENLGDLYLLAGSLSGTSPGIPLSAGVLPLNFDAYFNASLTSPASVGLSGAFGTLDLDGRAFASLTVPGGITPLVGLTANHAFVVIDLATLSIVKVSTAAPLSFL